MKNKKIISNENSKLKSFKSSSKMKNNNSFEIKNDDSSSFLKINNDNKEINETEEKKDKNINNIKKENKADKIELIKSFSPLDNNIFDFEEIDHPIKSRDDPISKSLDKIIKGDDMDILSELMSLCDFLSLSSERIGFNPSLPKLIEEICKNLTKTYLPEIVIYSLQCINYILDTNPGLVNVLQKINVIPLIIKSISSVEDNTCADYAIKILENISMENSRILLENNILENIFLNVFDFLNIHQKKSIMKICHNIIISKRFNEKEYNTYIKPVINILTNLIIIDDNDNNDHIFISEKATIILYNIINYFKYGDYLYSKDKKEKNIIQELITNYNIIENFIEILNKYFIKNSQIITEQLIKNILKTIVLIIEISKEGMDKILSNKFLEIISNIINNENNSETSNNTNINNRKNSSFHNKRGNIFILEIFDVLIALFPSWKSKDENNRKILYPENKIYYDYFCKNIFLPLINNIMNKSINKILNHLIKLILTFIDNSDKNDIISFLPPKPISQIIIKLLDTKNNNNLLDAISLVKSLLEKTPENYIVNFIREGIVHNCKNLKIEPKKKEIKKDYINLNESDEYIRKFDIPPINKINSKDNKDKDELKNIININERKKEENYLYFNKEENNKENNNTKFIQTDDEFNKKNEKYKINEENSISLGKINNENLEKDQTQKLSQLKESDNEENEFRMDSEGGNEQEEVENDEDNEDNEDMELNDEESQNEEKEQIDEEEEEEMNSFILSKNSSSPFLEGKEKSKTIEKVKETDKKLELISSPFKLNLTQKESKSKKYDLLKEENKGFNISKIHDIFINDLTSDNKSSKEKITKNKNQKDKDKNNLIIEEKNITSSISKRRELGRKKRFIDFLKYKEEFNEMEDNLDDFEKNLIEEKLNDLMINYLSDEKINQYLSKIESKSKEGLMIIQKTLSNYQQLLSSDKEENKNKEKYIKEIIDVLTDENVSITLFELENSKILISLSNYIDPEFINQYNKLIDDNEYSSIAKLVNNLGDKNLWKDTQKFNFEIFEKISIFFKSFEGDKNKMLKFIQLLNESIHFMKCPIFLLHDNKKCFMDRFLMRPLNRTIRIRLEYCEEIFNEDVLNDNLIIDSYFKAKLYDLNMHFINNKRIPLTINNDTTFKNMTIILISDANIVLISNDKYDLCLKYFIKNNRNNIAKMDVEENDAQTKRNKNNKQKFSNTSEDECHNEQKENEIFNIDENWTYKEFIEKYAKKSIPFSIQFGLSIKPKIKENAINNMQVEKINNNNSSDMTNGFLDYFYPFTQDLSNLTEHINFDKYCFIKDYHNNIINSEKIKFSKCLMPSLYLISLLNICINKYNELFNLPKVWFINSSKNKEEWKNIFLNIKIERFLFELSVDQFKLNNTYFPILGQYIAKNNQSLIKFPTRLLSFKTSFPKSFKSLINLQNHIKHLNLNNRSRHSVTLKKTMRIKIKVERDKIIEHGFNIMNEELYSKFKGYLEYEYIGEIGNGIGPTLEFYTLILDKIKEDTTLWYKTTNGFLYPRILNENENNEKTLKLFKLLGYFIGRAIYDDRLLDIPLNKVFWELVLDYPVRFKNIRIIDSYLYNTLSDFLNLINQKKEYIKNNNIENLETFNFDNIILYNKYKLSSLDIYFTFPGYEDIELKPNGKDILLTMNNIEEYVNLIYDFIFFRGVDKIIKSFKEGFNINFNIDKLKCFSAQEIEEFLCGNLDIKWEPKILFENIKPEHGYTNQSEIFNDLVKFMINLDKNQRRQFLIFSTGCPRLPIGGFKFLSPKLTVVKKYCEIGNNPDDYLPTVMTCQNYLKIPEYSNYKIFEQKMLLAMKEGCNEFNLS